MIWKYHLEDNRTCVASSSTACGFWSVAVPRGGGGRYGAFSLKYIFLPPPVSPKIMTNVVKLDQIWQFQYINGKNSRYLHASYAFLTFLPPYNFLLPLFDPQKWFWCCHWLCCILCPLFGCIQVTILKDFPTLKCLFKDRGMGCA